MKKFNSGWPTVLGFPLSELSFSAFSTKRMMDRKWHLRRERFIAYQAAMLICLAAECTATYSLSKYEDLQDHIEDRFAPAHLYQNDLIDFEIVIIVFCVFVATLFGADFFFLLQFPKHRYPDWYQNTKKFFAIFITTGVFVGALGSTIVVARNTAQIVHVSPEIARQAAEYYYRPPLQYNQWAVNIAFVVLIWIGWVSCVAATIMMFMAASYDKMHPDAFPQERLEHESRMNTSTERVNRAEPTATGQSSFDLAEQRPYSMGVNGSEAEKLSTTTRTTSNVPPLRPLGQDGQHTAV
ncbi:hypothetical protein JCM16303_005237 [Sporobolomyces ruberrimus]